MMSQTHVEVEGTVVPDGTLVLDTKLEIRPGRVRVTINSVPQMTDIEQFLATISASRGSGISSEERAIMDAEREAFRNEFEERFLEIERNHTQSQASTRSGERSE